MATIERWVTVLALVLGLAGCGATSYPNRSHTEGQADRAAQRDRRDRHAATRPYAPLGLADPGAGDDADDDEPHASRIQVTDARSIARGFFTTSVAFLYEQFPAQRVTGADPNLRRELEQGHATTTPAERAARPRIQHLSVSPAGPPVSVIATTTVTTGCCSPSRLSATLAPHGRGLVVVAVNG